MIAEPSLEMFFGFSFLYFVMQSFPWTPNIIHGKEVQNSLKLMWFKNQTFWLDCWSLGDPTTHSLWYWKSVSEYRTIVTLMLVHTKLNTGFSSYHMVVVKVAFPLFLAKILFLMPMSVKAEKWPTLKIWAYKGN